MMVEIENNWLKVSISQNGAEVREVQHKKNGLNYMWTGDSAYWGRVSPVLFPIVGSLKENQYQLDGNIYKLSQHGFLRDNVFEVDKLEADYVSFVIESAGQFTHVYPYEFKAYIHYTLKEDSLIVRWEIVNENKEAMYFSIGAHPAFKLPLLENEKIEDYILKLTPGSKEVIEYELKDSLIYEKGPVHDFQEIPITPSLFAKDALVYSHIDHVTLTSKTSSHGVELTFNDFPFVGIWSKYNETDRTMAPFVCVEPWYGIADTHDASGDLKEKFGVNRLEAGETFSAEYGMKFN